MGKGGWAGVISAEPMGCILCGSVFFPRAPGYVEPLQGPRQSSHGDGLRSEAQALPVQAQGSTRPVSRGLHRHATSRRRSWLSGCPGVWGLMLPFHPRRVVPAPQVAEGASEQGQASSRSHAALLWCLCWGSCEVLWATCRWAQEREVGVCREAGCPSCLQCPRRAVGQSSRGRNAEQVQKGACGGCDGGEEGVGKLESVFSRERAASFWKEK